MKKENSSNLNRPQPKSPKSKRRVRFLVVSDFGTDRFIPSLTALSMKKVSSLVSNNCNQTIEKGEKVNEGGIGYGIRRLVAERATSARDGVNLAIDLVKKYGYFQEGRTYTIADANEAWQLVLLRGSRYVARKVQDDEIAFLANAINITNIDLKDTANVIASPDLIENAIKKGTYKPKDPKNFSDFNLRKATSSMKGHQRIGRRNAFASC